MLTADQPCMFQELQWLSSTLLPHRTQIGSLPILPREEPAVANYVFLVPVGPTAALLDQWRLEIAFSFFAEPVYS